MLTCFKAYDVRGRIPDELNPALAYQIGQAYAALVKPGRVAVGRDIRHSSLELQQALVRGLTDSGGPSKQTRAGPPFKVRHFRQ